MDIYSENNRTLLIYLCFYLKYPATIRKPIKMVKPNQTPGRPIPLGANSKIAEDIAPTII